MMYSQAADKKMLNLLSANPTKWSNALKHFVSNLAPKGLKSITFLLSA